MNNFFENDYRKEKSVEEVQQILSSINWNDSRVKSFYGMYKRMEHLFNEIYVTTYGYRTILSSLFHSGVFRFDNQKFELHHDGKVIWLRGIKNKSVEQIVYEDGVFFTTRKNWLMESRQGRGRKSEYKCFTVPKNGDFDEIIIPDHHLQALFKYGEIVLSALGEDQIYCIDHLNENKQDNHPDNLEVITKEENRRRYHERKKLRQSNSIPEDTTR